MQKYSQMRQHFTKKLFILLFLFWDGVIFAENVRLTSLEMLDVSGGNTSAVVRYGAGVAIKIDTDMLFLQGVEIEIKQSNASLNFPNSLEYLIMRCSETLDSEKVQYRTKVIERKLLPQRVSTRLQFSTREKHGLQSSAYSKVLPYTFKNEDGFILVQLLPILKGLTTEFEQALFTITAKPIYTNEGGLNMQVKFPNPNKHTPLNVTLNETPVTLPEPPEFFTLPIGGYKLIIEADGYRTEVRNINIEQARISTLEIPLHSIIPLLFIYVPNEVEVLLDRKPINVQNIPLEISPGKHTVKLKLGTYEVLRQIDAEEGKTYTITMDVGVDVKVDE